MFAGVCCQVDESRANGELEEERRKVTAKAEVSSDFGRIHAGLWFAAMVVCSRAVLQGA